MSQTVASLLLLLLSVNSAPALRICSFNVRSFGETKKENQGAMEVIVKVSLFAVSVMAGHLLALFPPLSDFETLEEFNLSEPLEGKVAVGLELCNNNNSNSSAPNNCYLSVPCVINCKMGIIVSPAQECCEEYMSW